MKRSSKKYIGKRAEKDDMKYRRFLEIALSINQRCCCFALNRKNY